MKSLTFALAFMASSGFSLASSQALETCPELAGHYRCQALGKSVNVNVTQSSNIFYLEGFEPIDEVIADGNIHQVPDGDFYRRASYRGECRKGEVHAHIVGDVYQGAWKLGRANADLILRPSANGGLYRALKGEIRGPFSRTPINDRGTCARID